MSITNRPIVGFSALQEAYSGLPVFTEEKQQPTSNNELRRLVKLANYISRHTIAGILVACSREQPTYGSEMWEP